MIEQTLQAAWQHQQSGQVLEAELLCREILRMHPNQPQALHLLGTLELSRGYRPAALDLFQQAVAADANNPQYHFDLGVVLAQMGRMDEAMAAFRSALKLRPDQHETHTWLGVALATQDRMNEAIPAFEKALALNPNSTEALYNLALAYHFTGRLDEAIATHRRALALRPQWGMEWNNLGNSLKEVGRLDEALACFEKAYTAEPPYPQARSNRLCSLYFHPKYDAQAILREHQRWNREIAEPLKWKILPHDNSRDGDRKIRIGYVSPDFRDHVVGRNIFPALRDRDQKQFEVVCYSNTRRMDAFTELCRAQADEWRNIVDVDDDRAAQMIRADRIDILVDLSLHLADNGLLIFARKPAPIQVTFAGYPGTTGLAAMDYRLTDPHLDPPESGEGDYSERSVRLPHSFWCYDERAMELSAGPEVNPLPALSNGWITFGCLNNFCKVNDEVLAVWARVMRGVANSRLILLSPRGEHRRRILELLSPAPVEFVEFSPRSNYLRHYHKIDIGLDTFPYNGHTTSLDSVWMGVPVVSLCGMIAVGRAGLSQSRNLGLSQQLVGENPEQFVELARSLAGDLEGLSRLRSTLRQRMKSSSLMNSQQFARDLESVYRKIWRQWCR